MDRAFMIKTIKNKLGATAPNFDYLNDREVAELYKKAMLPSINWELVEPFNFKCPYLSANDLAELLKTDGIRQHRKIKAYLDKFCSNSTNKMFAVYGLRRTGKSVLMRSKALELMKEGRSVVFFDFEKESRGNLTFDDLLSDLKICKDNGVEYVFIDEITFLRRKATGGTGNEYFVPEFPECGLDIYALLSRFGIHVVVSGTDSYCLSLAKGDKLFDRMTFLHTTPISYSEFVTLVGKTPVLDYLKIGGVLPRNIDLDWDEYLNTAIINNIVSSIQAIHPARTNYRFNSIFRDEQIRTLILYVLSMSDISFLSVVLDILYRREYSSQEFGDGTDLLSKRKPPILLPKDFRDKVKDLIIQRLGLTEIDPQMLDYAKSEMEGVLRKLDAVTPFVLREITVIGSNTTIYQEKIYALSIPGLRNYQLSRTLESVEDVVLDTVSVDDKTALSKTISESSEGHLLEYLLLSDTVRCLSTSMYNVNQYRVLTDEKELVGEVDMVVENKSTNELCLFEVKRSNVINEGQVKHFIATDFMDGFSLAMPNLRVKSYNVIYLGKTVLDNVFSNESTGHSVNVRYINAEEYLLDITRWIGK